MYRALCGSGHVVALRTERRWFRNNTVDETKFFASHQSGSQSVVMVVTFDFCQALVSQSNRSWKLVVVALEGLTAYLDWEIGRKKQKKNSGITWIYLQVSCCRLVSPSAAVFWWEDCVNNHHTKVKQITHQLKGKWTRSLISETNPSRPTTLRYVGQA